MVQVGISLGSVSSRFTQPPGLRAVVCKSRRHLHLVIYPIHIQESAGTNVGCGWVKLSLPSVKLKSTNILFTLVNINSPSLIPVNFSSYNM